MKREYDVIVVGIESAKDIINDLKEALKNA